MVEEAVLAAPESIQFSWDQREDLILNTQPEYFKGIYGRYRASYSYLPTTVTTFEMLHYPEPEGAVLELLSVDDDLIRLKLVFDDKYNLLQHAKLFYGRSEELILAQEEESKLWVCLMPRHTYH